MRMPEDDEDPYVPSPEQFRELRRLESKPELYRLKALVRMFLDAIDGVPMRALDCDQLWVEELWGRLHEATKRRRNGPKARGKR